MIVVSHGIQLLFYVQAINNCNLRFENTALFTIALQKWEILWYKSYTIHIGSKNRTSQNTGRRSQRKYKEKDILCSCVCAESLQSCTALCDPMRCNLLGSPVHMVLQARVLVWVSMPFPGDLPDTGIPPTSLKFPALADGFLTTTATWVSPPCW